MLIYNTFVSLTKLNIINGSINIRWLVLFSSCWILLGNYYAFDTPSSINRQLNDWVAIDYHTYQYQFGALYSACSAPNLLLPLFSGSIIDKYGAYKMLLFSSILVCIGQGLFVFGTQWKSFPWMIFGRFLFGIGGDSLGLAQTKLITDWFKGKELAFANGLVVSFVKLAMVLNSYFSPIFALYYGVTFATMIGFYICLLSVVFTFITVFISQHHHKQYKLIDSSESSDANHHNISHVDNASEELKDSGFSQTFWSFCGAIIPFNIIASDLLQNKYYPNDPIASGFMISIPHAMSMMLSPFIGYGLDRYGHKLNVLSFGTLCLLLCHFTIVLNLFSSPIYPFLLLGLAKSTILAFLTSIPLLVPSKRLALANGIFVVCVNGTIVLNPLLVAYILSFDATFYMVEVYFMAMSMVSLLIAFILLKWNDACHLGLNEPEYKHQPLVNRRKLNSL